MIKTEKEPDEFYQGSGVYEDCIFCGDATDMWNTELNEPVCNCCSTIKSMDDLKKKSRLTK